MVIMALSPRWRNWSIWKRNELMVDVDLVPRASLHVPEDDDEIARGQVELEVLESYGLY